MAKSSGPVRVRMLGFLLVSSLIIAIPTLPAIAAAGDEIESVDPASDPIATPDPVPPPTDEQRQPVLDFSDLEGLWPQDVEIVTPGEVDPATPDEALADAALLETEGTADTDIYADGSSDSSHIAVIQTDDVNKQTQAGAWRDIKLDLDPEGKGWSWTDPSGVITSFPAALSDATPVTIAADAGTLSIAPVASESKGSEDASTVRYVNVFAGADITYTASLGGVQERVVLSEPLAGPSLDFTLTTDGLTLASNLYDGIDVMAGDEVVATLPAPVAYDSSEEIASSTGTYTLTQTDKVTYDLTMIFDEEFLKTATYPVIIDPTWNDAPNRDGYTNGASPGTSYESNDYLQVDSNKRSYLKFDTSALSQSGVLIYDATLFAFPNGSGGVTGGIDAKRVTDDWPNAGTLNWNNQPAVGASFDNVTSAGPDPWWDWDVTALYQHYVDPANTPNTHWTNEGVALTASNPKTFYAVDSSLQGSDPQLYVIYNNLPHRPTANGPADGYISESDSLTLKTLSGQSNYPTDPDGDDVLIGFQISDDGVNWTGSHLIFASPFDDKVSFTVPSGVLTDGQTYWWRAVSRDVCDKDTEALCSLTDGAGSVRDPNGTTPQSFTIAMKHYGADPKWYMWSHELGNSMNLQVNGSNGNLYLDLPLDTYSTPIGDIGIDLAYNGQRTADCGLSPGWDVAIGPRSSRTGLPVELTKMESGNDSDLKIRFRGGRTLYFPHSDGKLWGASSAMSGWVHQAKNDEYTYVDGDGGRYVFDSNALNGSQLLSAKPASSADAAPNKQFNYTYNTSLQLSNVTDPLGRSINPQWTGNRLEEILVTDYQPGTGTTPRKFDLVYDATTQKLTSIVTPAGETIDFTYVPGNGAGTGLLSQVRDGASVNAGASADGWDITYVTASTSLGSIQRVSTITAPDTGSPTSVPTPWTFRYHGANTGFTVGGVCITDPRGAPLTSCDAESANDDPYETQVEFSTAGYPIEKFGPHGPAPDSFRRDATWAFDNHNNLLCERTPEANVFGGHSCTSIQNGQGQYIDLDDGGLSTVYDYQNTAPYRLKSKTKPAAGEMSAYPRLEESYVYDGGTSFNGLAVEMYGNENLNGQPDDERIWNNLDQDWGTGKPGGVTGDANTWSLRLSGDIDLSGIGGGKKVKFRVYSDDGVRLTLEGATILDCFNDDNTDETTPNCGGGQISKVLWGTTASIQVEYADHSGDASLEVQWDQGNGNWQVIPGWTLTPDLGIVTSTTYSKVTSSNTVDLWQERWTYPSDDLKFRHLYEDHIRDDLAGTTYTDRYTYDTTYGHVLTETKAYGAPKQATTTFAYLDGAVPANTGWPSAMVGLKVSCMTQAVDQLGFTTKYQCDRSGNQTKQIQTVRQVSGTDQGLQPRNTVTTYDMMGRVTDVLQDETDQETITSYDKAGRVLQTRVAIVGTTKAQTDYLYDHAGHLMKETLPDPDGGGALTSPVIQHQWDWVDNETKRIDARGKQWQTAYDAENRVISTTSPLGAVTATTYQLSASGGNGGNGSAFSRTIVDNPAGVSSATDYNVLGQEVSETLESYAPTTYEYDVLGNQTKVTDPAGVQTKSTYSNLSELLTTTKFFNSAQNAATTTNAYNQVGLLSSVDGPLTSDTINYTYDELQRLTKAEYPSVPLPGGGGNGTPVSASITYNDAGERIQVSQPLTTSTTMNRYWSYDEAGRQKTYRDGGTTQLDPNFTTTTSYNLAGWVTQVADPRPQTVYFGYDNLGRQVCRHTATCTGTTSAAETRTYDAAGNVTQAKTPSVTYNMTYDDDGRLATVKRGTTLETTYAYNNPTAQLTSVADAAGTTSYTYNAAGQISTVNDPLVTGSPVTTYGYDGTTGQLLGRTDAQANLAWARTYETDTGRLDVQTIKNATTQLELAKFDLAYDKASDVLQKDSTVFSNPSNGTWIYQYDGAHRLTQATGPNTTGAATTWNYTYDGAGNRSEIKEVTGSTTVSDLTTTYNAQGQPASATNTTGESITYAHDKVGNLTKIDSSIAANDTTYTYDAYSRLKCARLASTTCPTGGTSVEFAYDAFDRAFSRAYNSQTTSYTYQGVGEVVAKAVVGSTTTTYAHTEAGAPLAEKVGTGSPMFDLRDPHGDVIGMVSTSAVNQGTSAFDPYGKVLATTGTQSTFGYQGDITDPITKQVDMGTRWYTPSLGRFTSRDVVFGEPTSPMSLNQHSYASMNPITMQDPTGMRPYCEQDCASTGQGYIIRQYSQRVSEAGGYSCNCSYAPSPVPPRPAPKINYSVLRKLFVQHGPVLSLNNVNFALDAADEFDVDPALLISLMVIEGGDRQRCEWCSEEAEKVLVANKVNPSIGIMQMKLETFKETTLRHLTSFGGPGPHIQYGVFDEWRLAFSARLRDERTAIRYAAAHVADLKGAVLLNDGADPAVLAGLYNAGLAHYPDYLDTGSFGTGADNYVAAMRSPNGIYAQVSAMLE